MNMIKLKYERESYLGIPILRVGIYSFHTRWRSPETTDRKAAAGIRKNNQILFPI